MATSKNLSDDHLTALAEGREQGRAVRNYLEALESHRPKRGRKRTPESMGKRLEKIDVELETADTLKRLGLVQERIDLQAEIESANTVDDLSDLETEFTAHAKSYSERKGITYAAWREIGVSAATLKNAGITRATT